ncbi:hypothetical protein PYCC9005_001302 [Savitreella phatthalungensis]
MTTAEGNSPRPSGPSRADSEEQHWRKSVRTPIACLACRRSKIKCRHNGAPPCRHCSQSGKQCIIPTIIQDDEGARSSPQPVKRRVSAVEGVTPSFKRARYEGGPHNLPCREIMAEALELFFQHSYNDMFGIFHKPTFEKQWREGEVEACVCLAILTLSARLSRQIVKDFEDEQVASEHFCRRALALVMPHIDKPSIPRIQCLIMVGAYLWSNSEGARAWIYIGIAIRMAQVLGLANAQAYPPARFSRGVEFIEAETRRRTFWSCFLMDRLLSNGLGRPQMIARADVSVPLPQDNTNFTYGTPEAIRYLHEELHPGETHLPECTGTMAAYIELMDLWSELSRWTCSRAWRTDTRPPWDEQGDFYKLQAKFDQWRARLPSSLQLNPQTLLIQLSQKHSSFALMYMVYNNGLLFLHRSYLTFAPPRGDPPKGPPEGGERGWREPQGFWQKSAHTAFEAAEQIISLNRELVKSESPLCVPFALFSIFSASSVMAYLAAFPWSDPEISPRALQLHREGLGYLEDARGKWKMVSNWIETARKLYDLHTRFSSEGRLAYETTDHFADFRSKVLDYGTLADAGVQRDAYTSNVRSQVGPRMSAQTPRSNSPVPSPRPETAMSPPQQIYVSNYVVPEGYNVGLAAHAHPHLHHHHHHHHNGNHTGTNGDRSPNNTTGTSSGHGPGTGNGTSSHHGGQPQTAEAAAAAWGMQNLNQDSLLAFMLGNNAEVFGNDLQLEPLIGMSGW